MKLFKVTMTSGNFKRSIICSRDSIEITETMDYNAGTSEVTIACVGGYNGKYIRFEYTAPCNRADVGSTLSGKFAARPDSGSFWQNGEVLVKWGYV